jgi:hypothetical protein
MTTKKQAKEGRTTHGHSWFTQSHTCVNKKNKHATSGGSNKRETPNQPKPPERSLAGWMWVEDWPASSRLPGNLVATGRRQRGLGSSLAAAPQQRGKTLRMRERMWDFSYIKDEIRSLYSQGGRWTYTTKGYNKYLDSNPHQGRANTRKKALG